MITGNCLCDHCTFGRHRSHAVCARAQAASQAVPDVGLAQNDDAVDEQPQKKLISGLAEMGISGVEEMMDEDEDFGGLMVRIYAGTFRRRSQTVVQSAIQASATKPKKDKKDPNDESLLFIHIFCHRTTPYHFVEDDGWMAKNFFSGRWHLLLQVES